MNSKSTTGDKGLMTWLSVSKPREWFQNVRFIRSIIRNLKGVSNRMPPCWPSVRKRLHTANTAKLQAARSRSLARLKIK